MICSRKKVCSLNLNQSITEQELGYYVIIFIHPLNERANLFTSNFGARVSK